MSRWSMYKGAQRDATRIRTLDDGESAGYMPRQPDADAQTAAVERLTLVFEAVWELASEKLGLTDDDLAAKVAEIDARSGARDGRRAPSEPRKCPSCDAAVAAAADRCQFCGADVPSSDPFAI
ncbi:MAG: hypothetical protein JJU45_03850 [Acidimicrobiia bacterium]|nr:hypothetical protein [Acidimicrobiia bacterium]